jgi:hypothetical protein
MRVALITNFAASRKEPLVSMMDRVHQGFVDSGLPEPFIRFNFADGGIVSFSSVDRVLKRHPELARFVTEASPAPQLGIAGARRLSNGPLSPGAGDVVPYATLQAIAAGVPRSFPFHGVAIHFHSPEFGEVMPISTPAAEMMSGILIADSWWVNGRQRSLSSCSVVEVEPGAKKLPSPSGPLATVLAACGKARKTIQAPYPGQLGPGPVPAVRLPTGWNSPSVNPELAIAVKAIAVKYRDRLPEIVKQAGLPHDLPGHAEMSQVALGVHAGPKKPALERVFKPMGYSVRGGTAGETGSFSLHRRTAANSTLELTLDCGTWSHSLLAIFKVWGLGWKATLTIPPTEKAVAGGQYPIGDAEQWQKIVENMGTLVAELERTFVPEIEAVTGPSPEWYKPES